jgi:hypothetical protein
MRKIRPPADLTAGDVTTAELLTQTAARRDDRDDPSTRCNELAGHTFRPLDVRVRDLQRGFGAQFSTTGAMALDDRRRRLRGLVIGMRAAQVEQVKTALGYVHRRLLIHICAQSGT